jgi:hypothetical protein
MVQRAAKKLLLSGMVAESRFDDDVDDEDIVKPSGPGMSQAELLSVLREGAAAILTTGDSSCQLSESQLDLLISRSYCTNSGSITTVPDEFNSNSDGSNEENIKNIDDILSNEVNLRELEGVMYTKANDSHSRIRKSEGLELDDTVLFAANPTKRIRKERIVMVDGTGSGYGGMVPILADTMDVQISETQDIVPNRRRNWSHMYHCCLCGYINKPLESPTSASRSKKKRSQPVMPEVISVRCAHCPLVFHDSCLNGRAGFKQGLVLLYINFYSSHSFKQINILVRAGMFICPHHKCAVCSRATAAAGGLLFRCLGCLTAYCEDCLPQERVEAAGRCEPMENHDYDSKQAYFIRCPACSKEPVKDIVNDESHDKTTGGLLNDVAESPTKRKEVKGEKEVEIIEEVIEEKDNILDTVIRSNTGTINNSIEEKDEVWRVATTEEEEVIEEEEEEEELLITQTMRLIWTEASSSIDSQIRYPCEIEEVRDGKVAASIRKKIKRSDDDSQEEDIDSNGEEELVEDLMKEISSEVPTDPCSLSQAVVIIQTSPAVEFLLSREKVEEKFPGGSARDLSVLSGFEANWLSVRKRVERGNSLADFTNYS